MKTLGIVVNPTKSGYAAIVRRIYEWGRSAQMKLFFSDMLQSTIGAKAEFRSNEALFDQVEAIMILGGDGTILNIIHQLGSRSIPVLGVNLGHLGFLAETSTANLEKALEQLQADDFEIQDRMILHGEIWRDNRCVRTVFALNDIVIYRGNYPRLIEMTIHISDEFLSTYSADGMILGTPTGSTGYTLSAGGPIIVPEMKAIVLTPINAHTLAVRPLIVPDHEIMTISLKSSNEHVFLTTDGLPGLPLYLNDAIKVTRAPFNARLIHLDDCSFYTILREKFKWGARETNLKEDHSTDSDLSVF